MTSLVIVSENKITREDYAHRYCAEHTIAETDRTVISKESGEKSGTKKIGLSIGIEQIKLMQAKLYLRPMKSPMKAVIILDAHLLTTEAQNALLKVLEEPPPRTVIILTADNSEALLPTILSRCTIVALGIQKSLTEQERAEYGQMLELLTRISLADGLKLAESLGKNKETALTWLEKMILLTRERMLLDYEYATIVQVLQTTQALLKRTNVNPRFTLEQLFLKLQQEQ